MHQKETEANNTYMGDMYNPQQPSSYINYPGSNNLYGLAMCQKLPYKDLQFVEGDFAIDDIEIFHDTNMGYILVVDLEYPENIHDYNCDYRLAPEIMNVKADMLDNTDHKICKSYSYSKEPRDEKKINPY